jgi:hypothetical protein
MLTTSIKALLEFLRPRFIGDDGNTDSGAQMQAQEQARQQAVRDAQRRIDAQFDGGVYVGGLVDPSQYKAGTTYYDKNGNPVVLQAPAPEHVYVSPADQRGGPGGGTWEDRVGPITYNGELYSTKGDGGKGFDSDYYNGIAKAYEDYYLPLVTEQYKEAQRKLAVGSNSTHSSAYLRDVGNLERDYGREQVGVKDRAQQAVADQRDKVESNRADLYRLADTGVGIDRIGNQAAQRAASLTAPPAYSPIGDLFGSITADYANREIARRAGYDVGDTPLLFDNSKRKGSVVTVNSS